MSTIEHELVFGAEVARRLGLSRERVRQLANNPRSGFPKPVSHFPSADARGQRFMWDWADVAAWATASGRGVR